MVTYEFLARNLQRRHGNTFLIRYSAQRSPFFRRQVSLQGASSDSRRTRSPNSSVKAVNLSLLYYNATSLFPKLDHLKAECSLLNPDIICITEIWLDDSITDNELRIPGFNLVRLDRNHHGGEVAIYIKSLFLYKIIFSGNLLECIIVIISSGSCKLCVCLFYRPPNSCADILVSLYSTLCRIDISLFSHFKSNGNR